MDTLFSNITAVTMDEQMHVYLDAFVGVTDGKISYLSRKAPEEKPQTIIDGTGMVLMPGLINGYADLGKTVLRGCGDDLAPGAYWEQAIFPRLERMDGRCAKASAQLGIAECLRFGVTSVSLQSPFAMEIAEALAQSGMKANIAQTTQCYDEYNFDFARDPDCQKLEQLCERYHNFDHGRIKVDAAVQGEYTSNYVLWQALAEYRYSQNLGLQLSLSETAQEQESCLDKYGLTPAQVLDCHHLWDGGGQAAHCVFLTEADRKLLAKHTVSAVHCPSVNAKTAVGTADVLALVQSGMNVCLGTGDATQNNNLDLLKEVRAAALAAKALHQDPEALKAPAALMLGTVCGARAQRRERECGMIQIGLDADLIMLDFTQPHLIPCHNVISNLVYAAEGGDVCMTMVRGKILYAAGKYQTLDLPQVMKELGSYVMPKLFAEKD